MTYLFVSEDVNVIMSSVDVYLKCIGIFFIPLAIVNIYRNGIQGLGYGLLSMMAGVVKLFVSCVSDRRRNAQLYRGLSGRTGCMVAGGGAVDRNVFLHYECTFEKSIWDERERLMKSFLFCTQT